MELQEIRKEIDQIDQELKALIMRRLDCSLNVVAAKVESGEDKIYRPEREKEILAKLSVGVSDDREGEYLAIVKKMMEVSRMYQYKRLVQWGKGEKLSFPAQAKIVSLQLTIDRSQGNWIRLLTIIDDYGYSIESLSTVNVDGDQIRVKMEIGRITVEEKFLALLLQLSQESKECILL